MDLKLKDKHAIVLGGTRGIGRSIAETLADEGCHVAICARDADQVGAAVASLALKGVKALGAPIDIANGAALTAWIEHAGEELGGLEILICNASALATGNSDEDWQQCLEVDVLGCKRAAEAAYPMLEAAAQNHGDAALVAISSITAIDARLFRISLAEDHLPVLSAAVQHEVLRVPTEAATPVDEHYAMAYGALKGALIHLIKGFASQWASKGVRANVVTPGSIYFKGGALHWVEENSPELFRQYLLLNPTGRLGTPEEIANAVVFLASPRSSFTTGANLVVDGTITGRVNY